METLWVDLPHHRYPIHIGAGLLDQGNLLLPHLPQKKVAIVTNETVAPFYLDRLSKALADQGIAAISLIIPDGEAFKNGETLNRIYDGLLSRRCERGTTVIALGGGVVGDMAGFAAATYQRGVPFMQIPTTLLAQVDSSVGGKTGINHPLGKNMIGAFHQPNLVLADTDTLHTLPRREFLAGLSEVIKYSLIRDRDFFDWLESHMDQLLARDPAALTLAIRKSCATKAAIVMEDERETGVRALLNLGHTFGHAIETAVGYGEWRHGEAVAAGMVLAARLSERLGHLPAEQARSIVSLLRSAGLPVAAPRLGAERYLELMGLDKKVRAGKLRFVLLRSIGAAFITDAVPTDTLRELLAEPDRDA